MQKNRMKAVVIEAYGGVSELKEKVVEKPVLLDNQVLVEVKAAAVNPIDWKLREGFLQDRYDFDFPIILGWDVAGVVTDIGKHVQDFQIGDRVFARPELTRYGTYAEFTVVDEVLLARIPDNISFEQAASVPLAGLTAYQALFDLLEIMEGQKVLIHAGAGGVGTYAIQLAKLKGAYVATTASKKNHGYLTSLGADQCIDYQSDAFEDILNNYDAVLDTVGGKTLSNSMKVLRKGGKVVSIVEPPSEQEAQRYKVREQFHWLIPRGDQLQELASLLEQGRLKPAQLETFPFSERGIRNAQELSESGHTKGKIVIKMG